jgi:RNA polymerase-binding transcription factor DksA
VPPPGTIVNVDKADPGDLRLLDLAEGELEDVERALRRLDEGTYAICEVCGRTIGEDRLASSAVTRRCADHAPAVPPGSPPGI